MRYSLVSRFRGALLGGLLAETLAQDGEKQSQIYFDVSKIGVLGAKSLIKLGKLDVDDWLERQRQESLHLYTTDGVSPIAIVATIPVALFFHENTTKLRLNLLSVLNLWEDDPVLRDGTLAVGYAIAQSLTEQLHPRTLIPETIAFIGETSTSLPQKLLKINNLLDRGAGLEQVQAELSRGEQQTNAIAMAFYCFLSTLEDFRLSVLQAIDVGKAAWPLHSQTISVITGILSGAYNATVGIPIKWQVLVSPANSTVREITNFSQMLELANALVTVWSGVYHFAPHPSEFHQEGCFRPDEQAQLCVYAAPRVIRSR